MNSEKGRDLHRVHVTDRAEAPSPGVTVAVRRQQIPPKFHLLFERWSDGLYEVLASGEFRGVIASSGVFVGISIIAAGGQSIVGKKRAAGELFCGLIQQVIHRGAILVEGEFIVNRGDTRGHTKIIFGEMDECMSFCIVESCGVKQGDVRCPFLGRQTLSQGVVVQVLPETFQRHCCIKLSPGFSSMAQFDLSHFSNHLRDVMVRNRPRPSKLRIGAERAHEGSPGEFTSRQRADYAVRGRVESPDIGNMGSDFSLRKVSDLLI